MATEDIRHFYGLNLCFYVSFFLLVCLTLFHLSNVIIAVFLLPRSVVGCAGPLKSDGVAVEG